jgi:hypothetical protein
VADVRFTPLALLVVAVGLTAFTLTVVEALLL